MASSAPEQQHLGTYEPSYHSTPKSETARSETSSFSKEAAKEKLGDFCNDWVVDERQFSDYPRETLVCARILRVFLIVFVITSTLGLIVGFCINHSMETALVIEQHNEMASPSAVICPSPWGTSFTAFEVGGVTMGVVPGTSFKAVEYKAKPFDAKISSTLEGCHVVQIDQMLHTHGKRGEYTGFDTLRVNFKATTQDGFYNFGFSNSDGPLPQRWSYGSLDTRITGELSYDQLNIGETEISEGEPKATINFLLTGEGTSTLKGSTELEFFYGYFMTRMISAQAGAFTVFAIVSFILLVAASVNNFGLFDIFFVESQDPTEDPPKLEPNSLWRLVCGACCTCCKPTAEPTPEKTSKENEKEV